MSKEFFNLQILFLSQMIVSSTSVWSDYICLQSHFINVQTSTMSFIICCCLHS